MAPRIGARPRPYASSTSLEGLSRLLEIPLKVCAHARERRNREVGQRKLAPGDLFIDVDISGRGLQNDVLWDFGNGTGVGIAARGHPAPDEILVERIGRRAGGKARGIARGK